MHRIIVAGIGTEVGKTVVSAILAILYEGDYWKPIQSGPEESSDTAKMRQWLDPALHQIHAPAYSFCAPLSPHHASRLEQIKIRSKKIDLPNTARPLIIETVGGVYSPLTENELGIELFKRWEGTWILVSKHYLGSINHTLLTIEALKRHGVRLAGLLFNGTPYPEGESAILKISQLPLLGRVLPEEAIDIKTIKRYAAKWKTLSRLKPAKTSAG
jgi:dethiobiotin synthetase